MSKYTPENIIPIIDTAYENSVAARVSEAIRKAIAVRDHTLLEKITDEHTGTLLAVSTHLSGLQTVEILPEYLIESRAYFDNIGLPIHSPPNNAKGIARFALFSIDPSNWKNNWHIHALSQAEPTILHA